MPTMGNRLASWGARGETPVRSPAAVVLWTVLMTAIASGGCAARATAGRGTAPAAGDWSAMATVPPGSTVRVELEAGRSATGRLVSTLADRVTVASDGSPRTFMRSEIGRVLLVRRRTAAKATRGLIVGALAGGLIGAFGAESSRAEWGAGLAAGWGAVGAAIGASDGFFDRDETLVYVASSQTVPQSQAESVAAYLKGLAAP